MQLSDLYQYVMRLHAMLAMATEECAAELEQRQISGNDEEYDGLAGVVNEANDVLANPLYEEVAKLVNGVREPPAPITSPYIVEYRIGASAGSCPFDMLEDALPAYRRQCEIMRSRSVHDAQDFVQVSRNNEVFERYSRSHTVDAPKSAMMKEVALKLGLDVREIKIEPKLLHSDTAADGDQGKAFDPNRPFKMVCAHCGSDEVTMDIPCSWDPIEQQWTIGSGVPYDKSGTCNGECQGECSLVEVNLEGVEGMTDDELAFAIDDNDKLEVDEKFADGEQYWVYYLVDGALRNRSDEGYDTWRAAAIAGINAYNKQESERGD